MSPKIIAFETWKYTAPEYKDSDNYSDHVADRLSEENIKLAKLFTAMGPDMFFTRITTRIGPAVTTSIIIMTSGRQI